MEKDYSQSVLMMCSTYGGRDFSFEDENGPVRCVECGRVFSREELMRENGALVEAAVDDMKEQILKDASKKIQSMFKKYR